MTTHITKPRGRVQDAPVKTAITEALRAHPGGTGTGVIAAAIQLDRKCTRSHLYALHDQGRVISAVDKCGNRTRIVWALPGSDIVLPSRAKNIPALAPVDPIEVENRQWPRRDHRAHGAWRADNIPAVRSVFDLGVAA